MVINEGIKANQANAYGMTPLHFAVQAGNVALAQFLVGVSTNEAPFVHRTLGSHRFAG